MPQIIDNPDGSKTFAVNSSELRVLGDRLVQQVPDVKKMLQFIDLPEVRLTLDFIKSVVD